MVNCSNYGSIFDSVERINFDRKTLTKDEVTEAGRAIVKYPAFDPLQTLRHLKSLNERRKHIVNSNLTL